jgi:hypothetical protein
METEKEFNLEALKPLLINEALKPMIINAFLFGYDCGGKSDNPRKLAEIYFEITYGAKNGIQ